MTLGAGVSPVSHKQPLPLKPSFSSCCKIECFYACPVFLWRDASGIKLKKKVIDGSTITTTEYMDGFQYTNNTLDFFPHTSTAQCRFRRLCQSTGGRFGRWKELRF